MIPAGTVMRVARPTNQLDQVGRMYIEGLGFSLLFSFQDHEGFDGIIVGHPGQAYHLEFTHHRGTKVPGAPSQDNLLAFYIPERQAWEAACSRMLTAGFRPVTSYNPYWDRLGRTFEDIDGYRVVLQNEGFV